MLEFMQTEFDPTALRFGFVPEFVLGMVISIVCGLLVGLEREARGKPAGARTLVLICLGSTLFVQVSLFMAGNYGDPARVAAQVVTGIGFLGAGAILQYSEKGYVAGLTTAASIWVIAAIGMIVGAGYYLVAFVGVLFVIVALRALRILENHLFYEPRTETKMITFASLSGKTQWMIVGLLEDNLIDPQEYEFREANGKQVLEFKYRKTSRNHRSFLAQLSGLSEVYEIN